MVGGTYKVAMNESVARDTFHNVAERDFRDFQVRTPSSTGVAVQTHPRPGIWNVISLWGCVLLSAAVFWWIAGQGARITAINYHIDNLQSQIAQQAARNAALQTTVNQLKQPTVILNKVKAMGAKPANPITIVTGTH